MDKVVVVGLGGFAAAMVDGALGMGFGPTSSSILLAAGLPPASVSATVNVAKVAAGLAAGASHWRFRNVDRRLLMLLAIPGAFGGLFGATVLSKVDGKQIRPWMAVLLMVVGARILARFRHPIGTNPDHARSLEGPPTAPTIAVGALGGLTNGLVGAWGPVATPYLLQQRVEPRIAVGSVNTAEVAVATASSASLLALITSGRLDSAILAAMLIGGVVAAPLAALFIRFLPPRPMGLAVALLLLITNVRELAPVLGLGVGRWVVYGGICALTVLAALNPRLTRRAAA